MSWIQNLGRFTKYRATNYVARSVKDICKKTLKSEIENLLTSPLYIPSVINGQSFHGNQLKTHQAPSYNKPVIYNYSYLNPVDYSHLGNFERNKRAWKNTPIEEKFKIFERIADLVEGKYFYKMIAATMVGQGKNYHEAELDCIAETVDFLRFNMQYAFILYELGQT